MQKILRVIVVSAFGLGLFGCATAPARSPVEKVESAPAAAAAKAESPKVSTGGSVRVRTNFTGRLMKGSGAPR